jgi:hypothetical protein
MELLRIVSDLFQLFPNLDRARRNRALNPLRSGDDSTVGGIARRLFAAPCLVMSTASLSATCRWSKSSVIFQPSRSGPSALLNVLKKPKSRTAK